MDSPYLFMFGVALAILLMGGLGYYLLGRKSIQAKDAQADAKLAKAQRDAAMQPLPDTNTVRNELHDGKF